jgi:hypothetical protein
LGHGLNPRAEHLRIDGVTGNDAQILERISASVVQEALQGWPLLTFRPEGFRFCSKSGASPSALTRSR